MWTGYYTKKQEIPCKLYLKTKKIKTYKKWGLPDKKPSTTSICLNKESELTFCPRAISKIFKEHFANLANNLHTRLPDPRRKFGIPSLRQHYKRFNFCGKGKKS